MESDCLNVLLVPRGAIDVGDHVNIMIVSMELEGHLPLDLLDHKIKQIGDMR